MKLTKQKLERLIRETIKEAEDIKRYIRVHGDSRMKTNSPEVAGKLGKLYLDDPIQATNLADTLGDPIDVELPDADEEDMVFDIDRSKQFRQMSRSSSYDGLVEIWYDGEDDIWNVHVLKKDNIMGSPYWAHTRYSKEFEGIQGKEAIQYYNKFADVPYKKGPDLLKRGDNFKL